MSTSDDCVGLSFARSETKSHVRPVFEAVGRY